MSTPEFGPAADQGLPADGPGSRPDTLPAGRHQLEEEEVREHQRGRLIEAIAFLCADRGYANIVITDIVSRAAVSKSTFYGIYQSKERCLFDAHKHYSAILLAEIGTARKDHSELRELLRATIRAALRFSAERPQAAELLTVGILSAGPEGRARYLTTMEAIAKRLCPSATRLSRRYLSALASAIFAAPTITGALEHEDPSAALALEHEFLDLALAFADPA